MMSEGEVITNGNLMQCCIFPITIFFLNGKNSVVPVEFWNPCIWELIITWDWGWTGGLANQNVKVESKSNVSILNKTCEFCFFVFYECHQSDILCKYRHMDFFFYIIHYIFFLHNNIKTRGNGLSGILGQSVSLSLRFWSLDTTEEIFGLSRLI